MRITLLTETIEEVREIFLREGWNSDVKLAEVCEYQTCQEWEWLNPIETGDLTEAPIITDGENVYWYSDYQIYDPVEKLLRDGFIDFQFGRQGGS